MGSLSIWHWIVVVVVVLLLFGRGKISELMGDMAQGIKAFKKGMSDDETPRPMPKPDADEDHQCADRPEAGSRHRQEVRDRGAVSDRAADARGDEGAPTEGLQRPLELKVPCSISAGANLS